MKVAYRKDREGLFTGACSNWTRENGFELKESRFTLDSGKKLFAVRMVRHWNRLPRETVDAPSLEMSKAKLDNSEQPGLREGVPADGRGLEPDDL